MAIEKMYVIYFMHIDLSNPLHLTIGSTTMFQNVEQWQTHQFSTFFPTTPLTIWAYTKFFPLEIDSMEYPSLPLEVDLY